MNVSERADLLERVDSLVRQRRFYEVDETFSQDAPEDILNDPQLSFYQALAWSHIGRPDAASSLLHELEDKIRRSGNTRLLRRLLLVDGALYMESGSFEAAISRFIEVLALSSHQSDARMLAAATLNLGAIAAIRHNLDEALASLSRAMAASAEAGLWHQVANCHRNLAMVYRDKHEYVRSMVHFERAKRYLQLFGTDEERIGTRIEMALTKSIMGEHDVALELATRAVDLATQFQFDRLRGEAHRVVGIVYAKLGEQNEAMSNLMLGRKIGAETNSKLLYAECLEVMSYVVGWKGSSEDAAAYFAEAMQTYESMQIYQGRLGSWFPELKEMLAAG